MSPNPSVDEPTSPEEVDLAIARLLAAAHRTDDATRPDILLQLARAQGLYGRFDAARALLEEADRLKPGDPALERHLGLALCRACDWRRGLATYDRGRWQLPEFDDIRRAYPLPEWSGDDPAGQRLLLWAEQGIGDQVMQLRALDALVEQGAEVTLEADPRLFPFVARRHPGVTCVPQTVALSEALFTGAFDAQISMLSAWRHLDRCLDPAPCPPYLAVDDTMSAKFREVWAAHGWRCNVGLAWHSAARRTGADKSIPVEQLATVLGRDGVSLHCLQYDIDRDGLGAINRGLPRPLLHDGGGDARRDIDRLAAQIAALDLVVAIDNATVHLAGAVGTPCWVLLPCRSDWRWGIAGDGTFLYAGMRLFRSGHPGRWGAVLTEIDAAFDGWLGTRAQS